MSYLVSPDRHSAFGGVASTVLLTALLTAPAANAAGGEETICDLSFGTPSGNDFRQHGVATFDSAIRDGLMVTVGDPVALDPVTGSIALEGEFADILLANGVTSAEGDGVLSAALPETGEHLSIPFHFGPTSLPPGGLFRMDVTGGDGTIVPKQAGTYTLVGEQFVMTFDSQNASVSCDFFGGDPQLDSFVATAASTPRPPTTAPVRPVLVQTDFAQEEGAPHTFTYLVWSGALAAGFAVLLIIRRARTSSRRH
jgi:hypothetical protein